MERQPLAISRVAEDRNSFVMGVHSSFSPEKSNSSDRKGGLIVLLGCLRVLYLRWMRYLHDFDKSDDGGSRSSAIMTDDPSS
jgi:hypothetical protein